MIDSYPNPWDFNNNDRNLLSTEKLFKVFYEGVNEIAMGGPITGQCSLETADNRRIKIHDFCGGPPAWETSGKLLAIPIWKRMLFKGMVQQIGVVNIETMQLKIYQKTFRVLDIRSFDKDTIYGYDSPLQMTTDLSFNIEKEEIDRTIQLE